ncbi:MAG: ATP-binding protein [Firmicutes bacterium]|nr:ATP-binding protein [Bacillota bacterium]
MDNLIVTAEVKNLDAVTDFVLQRPEIAACPKNTQLQLRLAVEEVFVNIASYAYDPAIGPAEVRCEVLDDPLRVVIQFLDHGKPFDPLAREDADTSEEALMERIGGLGILLVKETMDEVSYSYEEGKNILSILKKL